MKIFRSLGDIHLSGELAIAEELFLLLGKVLEQVPTENRHKVMLRMRGDGRIVSDIEILACYDVDEYEEFKRLKAKFEPL